MGIAYRLDHALALTVTVFDGKITGDEWRAAIEQMFADPEWPPGRLNLTDLRTADSSNLTPADRSDIYAINAAHAAKLVRMKSAAIGGEHFEETRDFERGGRSSGLRLIAFDDLRPACAWLGIEVEAVRPILDDIRSELRARKPANT